MPAIQFAFWPVPVLYQIIVNQPASAGDAVARFAIALTQVNRDRIVSRESCQRKGATRYQPGPVDRMDSICLPRIVIIRFDHVYSAHRK